LTVQKEGNRQVSRIVDFYNLDMIISVGYRIKSQNYLDKNELGALNNLVEQYLIFAEGQAIRRIPMHINDWIEELNGFLSLNDRKILEHEGKISHETAKELAESEYQKFNRKRIRLNDAQESDFDRAVKMIEAEKKDG
jgi:hypothetical protein